MIPSRLSIRNFLCYRENVPSLDFDGIHVACLCGPNGHGKSALLDAITWCLWGKARGKTQDGLISYGADEARVELDFVARDSTYRAIRNHSRGGGRRRTGVSDLQLQIVRNGDVQPLTGDSIRQTQTKIDQIVGMDYDTFINSAYLLQGRADEFSNKTPSERKVVLAKILGLDVYDRLQERAKVAQAAGAEAARELEGALGWMRNETEGIGDPADELTRVGQNLDGLALRLAEKRREIDDLRGEVRELERQRDQLTELAVQTRALAQEIELLETAIGDAKSRMQQYRDLVQQAGDIKQGALRLEQARLRFEDLEAARRRFDQLAGGRNLIVGAIDTGRARLETQVEQLKRRAESELPPKADAEPVLAIQRKEARGRLEGLELEAGKIAAQQKDQQTLATLIGETQSTAERYKTEGLELRSKLELLSGAGQGDAGEVCPLCKAPLDEDGCANLAGAYDTEIKEKRRLYGQTQSQLKKLESQSEELGRELPKRQESLDRAKREGEIKLLELERGIEESRQAQRDRDETQTQLAANLASLASGDFAAQEHSQLEELKREMDALGYDEDARQKSYDEMRELQLFEEQQRRLEHAVSILPQEEKSLAQSEGMHQRRREEQGNLQQLLQAGQEAIAALPQRQISLNEAQAAEAELEVSRQGAIGRQGHLEGLVSRLEELAREIAANSTRLKEMAGQQSVYQELVTALGRQGVQAMLIETVVPRVEEEANILLGRMTDNRMQLQLETQRERRTGSGDPIETLEILVSDELGPRSYEMYSGGEAFRVNLSLRIALSKVLAQRLGAPLPTLFIDEGFGTQDAAGRERILDVIGAIEQDFDKVIVITHLDELKDAFPVRIEVQKDETGSTFWLS